MECDPEDDEHDSSCTLKEKALATWLQLQLCEQYVNLMN